MFPSQSARRDATTLQVARSEDFISRSVVVLLLSLFLCACANPPSRAGSPVPTNSLDNVTATPAPTVPPTTISPATQVVEVPPTKYTDPRLCFTVDVPSGWMIDGVPGGFAGFQADTGQPSFRIVRVYLGEIRHWRSLCQSCKEDHWAHLSRQSEISL